MIFGVLSVIASQGRVLSMSEILDLFLDEERVANFILRVQEALDADKDLVVHYMWDAVDAGIIDYGVDGVLRRTGYLK